MSTIRFSMMRASDDEMTLLRQALQEFEARRHVSVEVSVLEWPTAWSRLLDFATYGDSPDVSLVGTTWITPLSGMQALRPFTDAETAGYGDTVFLASAWNAGVVGRQSWAIPWKIDTRVIFYWRSSLARAGIDERSAFGSYEALEETVRVLNDSGQVAIIAPTGTAADSLHELAGWVWSHGGDFSSPDGKCLIFHHDAALKAIQRYYRLHRLRPGSPLARLNEWQADRAFDRREAQIIIGGPWMVNDILTQRPAALEDLGIAPLPGTPYNGGSSLVIWRRSLQELPALDLIHFLASPEIQRRMTRTHGFLPARLEILTNPEVNQDPFFQVLSSNALRGRALSSGRLWAVIEERLIQTLGAIWKDIFALNPADLDAVVSGPIIRLATQLNTTIGCDS